MKLEPCDVVGVISDGFFEFADPSGQEFGRDRIAKVITSNSSFSMEKLVATLIARIEDFAPGEPQADDMTAVLVCRRS